MNPAAALTRLAVATATITASATAFAQEAGGAGSSGADPAADTGDPHRWALWTSCSVLFGAVILFLVATHRRAAASVDRLNAMERRLDEAEKRR